MSLNWSVEDVEDYETTCWLVLAEGDPNRGVEPGGKILNPVTECLIFMTLGVGIGRITKDNADEFYARVNFTETVNGEVLIRAEVDGVRPTGLAARITPAEVKAHIGLSTNASFKDESRANFLKRFNVDLDAAARRYSKACEERAVPA